MPANDFSVVGELNLDLILSGLPQHLELDREHLASGLQFTLGSSSAIFAHNLALLGNRVGFSSCIGEDSLGENCLRRLAAASVDTSRIKRFSGKTTGLTVILPLPRQRYILTYPGVMFDFRFEDLDLEYICDAKHFHLSSYFLHRALLPRMAELFQAVRKAGLTTSLDTNDDPEDQWESGVREILRYVDVLLPNEREACKLARAADAASAAAILSEKVPLVVVKRGRDGVLARRGREEFVSPPVSVVPVDTVGAGDSFDAGFLHQFIRRSPLEKCLAFGNLTGAFSTTRPGGTEAFCDSSQREKFLKEHA